MASLAETATGRIEDDRPEDSGYEMVLEISSETRSLLARLAAETGGTEFDVIGKALALYRTALDARREGRRIGILDPDDELGREIVGF
ncbi:hypothetical protein P12x_002353 [Tundrisphaera lichenicola]|uniref:hypothetical protein n=1 Tax=Tundrisphaera lichenicola TaxID=2029860 RepID=UPI003EB887A2